jgi:hypothetical protein
VVRDLHVGRGRQDREFFAADPEGSVGRPRMLGQKPTNPVEDDVPRVVPIVVIDEFEVVQVGEDQ